VGHFLMAKVGQFLVAIDTESNRARFADKAGPGGDSDSNGIFKAAAGVDTYDVQSTLPCPASASKSSMRSRVYRESTDTARATLGVRKNVFDLRRHAAVVNLEAIHRRAPAMAA
jgi:hypothetical protein